MLGLVLLAVEVKSEAPPEHIEAYVHMVQAGQAEKAGNLEEALRLYELGVESYRDVARRHPEWEPELVRYRVVQASNSAENIRAILSGRETRVPVDGPGIDPVAPVIEAGAMHVAAASVAFEEERNLLAARIDELERERAKLMKKIEQLESIPSREAPQPDSVYASRMRAMTAEMIALHQELDALREENAAMRASAAAVRQHEGKVSAPDSHGPLVSAAREADKQTALNEMSTAKKEMAELRKQLESAKQSLKELSTMAVGLNAEKAVLARELAAAKLRADVAAAPADDAVDHIERGYSALASGMIEDAVFAFRSELVLNPSSVEARIGLASCYFERDNLVEARKLVDQVLELDDRNARAFGLRGALKFREGHLGSARSDLQRALRLDENNAYNHNYLGVVYHEMGRTEESIEHLRKAVAVDPDYMSAHFNLAVILATSDEPALAAAAESYRRYLALGGSPNAGLEPYLAGY